jgi:sterol desaturase/sphingolipid hydroxylase (fatty acid hydroxylase superfamily)
MAQTWMLRPNGAQPTKMSIRERWLTAECVSAALGQPKRGAGIAVFRNAFVDRVFARAHPLFPAAFFGPIVALVVLAAHRSGHVLREGAAFAAGWLLLSLVEYLLHRFYFHRSPPPSRAGQIDAFLAHGYHHQYPSDFTRLVLPPLITVPLALVVFALAHLTLGLAGDMAFAGIVTGYVAYDTIHYLTHRTRTKRGPLAWLRRYHMLHHHDRVPGRYGVSMPLWDLVLGTYLPARRRSAPARDA